MEHTPISSATEYDKVVGEYFESIREAFEETLRIEEAPNYVGRAQGIAFGFLGFSVLPLLPFLTWLLFRRVLHLALVIQGHHLPSGSLVFWWLVEVVLFGAIFAALLNVKSERERKKDDLLSRSQMRFAYCRATAEELENY
jgi:hypothetical protein